MLSRDLDRQKEFRNFERNQLLKIKQAWKQNAIAQFLNAGEAKRAYFFPSYPCLGLPDAIDTEVYLEELEEQLLPPQ